MERIDDREADEDANEESCAGEDTDASRLLSPDIADDTYDHKDEPDKCRRNSNTMCGFEELCRRRTAPEGANLLEARVCTPNTVLVPVSTHWSVCFMIIYFFLFLFFKFVCDENERANKGDDGGKRVQDEGAGEHRVGRLEDLVCALWVDRGSRDAQELGLVGGEEGGYHTYQL